MQKINIQEIWKPIAECNGEYLVSNYGRVKSLKFGKEKILKLSLDSCGYAQVSLSYSNGKSRTTSIHRIVSSYFLPKKVDGQELNHIDGNKLNNNVTNLEWVSHKENIEHAWKNGLCKNIPNLARKRFSKPVIDRNTNIIYPSLTDACNKLNLKYSTYAMQIWKQRTTQRFEYIKL